MSEGANIGREFEQRFAQLAGGESVTTGNGNFIKGDVRGETVVWSCKATGKSAFRLDQSIFQEAREIGRSMGSRHGVAVELEDGEVYVVHPWSEYAQIMSSDEVIPLSKADSKRAEASIPAALRQAE